MKFKIPSKLELWAIGISLTVALLVIFSHGPLLAKICYLLIFGYLTWLILKNNANE